MLDRTANSVYDYTKPTQSREEQLVSASLVANAYADAANRKPPIPNIGKTAPRYGYAQRVPTISDLMNIEDMYPSSFGDWSGTVSGYGGTSYPQVQSFY
jgi:hypothetical protein